MKIGRIDNYPWYQELVTVISGIFIFGSASMYWSQLPAQMAGHFNSAGQPDGFAAKEVYLILFIFLFLLLAGVDTLLRYKALSAEGHKRFNWIGIIMTPYVPLMAWAWYLVLDFNLSAATTLNWHLDILLFVLGGSLLFAIITEKFRPAAILENNIQPEVHSTVLKLKNKQSFIYVDNQCPIWWPILILLSGVVTAGGGLMMIMAPPINGSHFLNITGVVTLVVGVGMLIFMRGFQYVVHPEGVTVKFAFSGIKLQHIPLASIQSVEQTAFSPLHDFGGWGFRCGKNNTVAFVLSGTSGILIKTDKRNYVLSTERAQAMIDLLKQLKDV